MLQQTKAAAVFFVRLVAVRDVNNNNELMTWVFITVIRRTLFDDIIKLIYEMTAKRNYLMFEIFFWKM